MADDLLGLRAVLRLFQVIQHVPLGWTRTGRCVVW